MQNNCNIVLEAVIQNVHAFFNAYYKLRNNYTIVLEAIKQNGLSIRYA